jgi:hypothetical protein
MTKFKKIRTLKEALSDPRVDLISDERNGWSNDGIWIYLKMPYYNTLSETSCIHEWSVKDCLDILNNNIIVNEEHWT